MSLSSLSSSEDSSSLMLIKFLPDGARSGDAILRPSRRARASERLARLTVVETVEVVRTEERAATALGAFERERRNEDKKDFLGEEKLRARVGVLGMDGRRGAGDSDGLGSWGSSIEGAGFGEGMVRNESLGMGDGTRALTSDVSAIRVIVQFLDALEEAFLFRLAERRDWDSARSSERNDLNSFSSRLGCKVK